MRLSAFYLMVFGLLLAACSTNKSSTNAAAKAVVVQANKEMEIIELYALEEVLKQLKNALNLEEAQESLLRSHPQFKKILQQNQDGFAEWMRQQKDVTVDERREALACLEQESPMATGCQENRLITSLVEHYFPAIIHEVSNYSINLARSEHWIPANEAGSTCEELHRGNYYYYLPSDKSDVVYLTREGDSQKESYKGQVLHRRITWTNPCAYDLTAWAEDDDFKLDFEVINVSSDHYIFLCRAPSEWETPRLLIGRINKSLE